MKEETEPARQIQLPAKPEAPPERTGYSRFITRLSGAGRGGDRRGRQTSLLHLCSKHLCKYRIFLPTSFSTECPREGQAVWAKVTNKLSTHRPVCAGNQNQPQPYSVTAKKNCLESILSTETVTFHGETCLPPRRALFPVSMAAGEGRGGRGKCPRVGKPQSPSPAALNFKKQLHNFISHGHSLLRLYLKATARPFCAIKSSLTEDSITTNHASQLKA